MSYRFTNTDKWSDTWFSNLTQLQMLLFIYLCENCDMAGFIEVNYKRWASDLNSSIDTIKGVCKGLQRGAMYSKDEQCLFLKNFLKNQKNYPLNEKNNCHSKIIGCFNKYSEVFEIKDINEFIQGACKGLISPIGSGSGSSIGNKDEDWYKDFEIYKENLRSEYMRLINDKRYISERKKFHPSLNIIRTLEKACKDFWSKEAGWVNKKQSKSINIDWEQTFNNALTMKSNQVYEKQEDKY